MTITVENGTSLDTTSPLPNSYVDVASLRAFAVERGLSNFAAQSPEVITDTQIEAALIKAEQYLRQKYRMRWKGSRVKATQPLDWPRRGVDVPDFFDPFFRQVNVPLQFQDTYFVAENEVPQEVRDAQMLLAIETFGGGTTSSTVLQGSLGRLTKREKLGSLEVEYMGPGEGGSSRQTTIYWDAEQLIQPYLRASSPHTGRLVRA